MNTFTLTENEIFASIDKFKETKPSTLAYAKNKENTTFLAEIFDTKKNHYDVQASWLSNGLINKGDIILARFAVRSLYAKQESGDGIIYFFVQQANNGNTKSVISEINIGPEWKTIDIPFVALNDMDKEEAAICFSFGALQQKVEIANVQLLNFEKKIELAKLPVTKFTYKGRETNAKWRKEALNRIEKLRTTPLKVIVVDTKNRPIKDCKVEVNMVVSDFLWGTAIDEKLLADDLPNSDKYRETLKEFFNTAVIENGFKGATWTSKPERRAETMRAFTWLEANKFRQRGHNLVWPAWKFNAKVMKEIALKDSTAFNDFIKKEITDKMEAIKGRVVAWDVVNELLHEREFFNYLPKNATVDWYKLAKKIDPSAALFINEYGMLNSIASPDFIAKYIETIQQMIQEGAIIEGVGIQGHVGRQPRNPEQVITDLDYFNTLGLPVQITEFDINMTDDQLQADYTRDFLIACYSHPIITGFTNWGFWEDVHWKPDAAMFRSDWSIKPNGVAWKELVCKKWKTSFSKKTDAKGEVNGIGHLGKYEITIHNKDLFKKVAFQLTKDRNSVTVVLD